MILAKIVSRLPFKVIYLFSTVLYFIVFYLLRYRRDTVQQNLCQAFPDKRQDSISVLSRNYYRHLCDFSLEIIKAHGMNKKDFRDRCSIVGTKDLIKASQGKTKPIIVLTIHQGNWEWMLHAVSLQLGISVDPVYKPLHHKGWDQFIREVRSRFNSRPIPIKRAGRDILKRRAGFRLFVMLADQAPTEGELSYWTSYLNKEAPFYLGAEKIAYLTQYPVFFAQCRRLQRGYYQLEFKALAVPPYENIHDKSNHPIIDAYVRAAEEAIHSQPETFLWSHRRWKRKRHH